MLYLVIIRWIAWLAMFRYLIVTWPRYALHGGSWQERRILRCTDSRSLIANEPFVGGGVCLWDVRAWCIPVIRPSAHQCRCNLIWMHALIDGFDVSAVEVAEEIENWGHVPHIGVDRRVVENLADDEPGVIPGELRVAGQAEQPFGDDVELHLRGATVNGGGPAGQ
jgi:hypothetical protein